MKGTSVAMVAELGARLARLAVCAKVTPRVAPVLTATLHDVAILDPTDGLTYIPAPGGVLSDVASDSSLSANNLEVTGALQTPFPTFNSLRAGDWDDAFVEIFYLCWADPSKGRHIICSGNIGQFSTKLSTFTGEFRSLLQKAAQSVGPITQPSCRHRLGDYECNLDGNTDPDDLHVTGTLDDVSADAITLYSSAFVELATPPAGGSGSFSYGKVRIEDGANAGRVFDIETSVAGIISLFPPGPPYALLVGAAFTAWYGCDGLRATCKNTYNNILNFDGEPWLPGLDKVVQVARSS